MSSYTNPVNFGDIIKAITFCCKPSVIVEFGILNGFSLQAFIDATSEQTLIEAYDIFEEFNGNGADFDTIRSRFQQPNVTIKRGDFFKVHGKLEYADIIHVDIANNGDVYEFAIEHYLPKIRQGGFLILEGGSIQRDQVEWMVKYNKPKIQPVIQKYMKTYDICTIGEFPSLTVIRKNNIKLYE